MYFKLLPLVLLFQYLISFNFVTVQYDVFRDSSIPFISDLLQNIEIPNTATEKNNATTTVSLKSTSGDLIPGSKVLSLFMNGWKFQKEVELNGYTATDDLWTFINNSNQSSSMSFDQINIELINIQQESEEWFEYINDIEQRSKSFSTSITMVIQ